MNRRAWIVAACGIVAVANAVALAGVAYNRQGEESRLVLTQRELVAEGGSAARENSGLSLTVRWRVLGREEASWAYGGWSTPEWLDRAKMAQLGFDVTKPATDIGFAGFRGELSREVYLVLEFDGPAYRESLSRATAAAEHSQGKPTEEAHRRDRLELERTANSRLFVVDAGLDRDTLRARYPDRSRYAIARGRVGPSQTDTGYRGAVESLAVSAINVPVEMRAPLGDVDRPYGKIGQYTMHAPFKAVVSYGQRLEPWLVSVRAGAANP